MDKAGEDALRKMLRQGILDENVAELLTLTGAKNQIVLCKMLFEQLDRVYTKNPAFQLLLLMKLVVATEETGTKMANILPATSLLQDTLEKRIMMVDKAQTENEKAIANKIQAAYISKEMVEAREIARENALLKEKLAVAEQRLKQIDEEVIQKTRDLVGKLFEKAPKQIVELADAAREKL